MKRRLGWVVLVAVIGTLISAYSLYHHFDTSEGWCNVSATLNCDVVNRGPYSEFAGIPVSLIGVVGYLGIAIVAILTGVRASEQRELLMLLRIAAAGALGFSLYLTYLEAFVLGVYCPLCLGALAIVVILCLLLTFPTRNDEAHATPLSPPVS